MRKKRTSGKKRLLVFSKYPSPGKAKTRLIPALGDRLAAEVQRVMTENLLSRLKHKSLEDINVHIVSSSDEKLMKQWLSRGYKNISRYDCGNHTDDLGAVLTATFWNSLREAGCGVIAIGSDIPDITHSIILEAFEKLKSHDVVLGPAKDGGYYLIGLNPQPRETIASLFDSSCIDWGTETVFKQQSAQAKKLGLSLCCLSQILSDVDLPEDLPLFERATGMRIQDMKDSKLSVVIPLRNARDRIVPLLNNIVSDGAVEVVLCVAGTSTDGTLKKCKEHVAELSKNKGNLWTFKVLETPPTCVGRGATCKYAAEAATGSHLLFLHDDTRLPPGFQKTVRHILGSPGVSAGAFSFALDIPVNSSLIFRIFMRVIEYGVVLRMYLEEPYGDQAIFVSRRLYDYVGGFNKSNYLFEDVELVRKLRKIGKIMISEDAVVTSSKRWQNSWCPYKNTIMNQFYVMAYNVGISPRTIFKWYYGFDPEDKH